jgi:hypothetical protein
MTETFVYAPWVKENKYEIWYTEREEYVGQVPSRQLQAYRTLVGKPEGQTSLGTSTRRTDNIKMDIGGMGWGGRDWIDLAQDRDKWRVLVNTTIKLRVP